MSHPPNLEMRSPADKVAIVDRANSHKSIKSSTDNIHEIIADRQASYLSKVYGIAYATAAMVARLAWGCAR